MSALGALLMLGSPATAATGSYNWTAATTAGTRAWISTAMSSDGSKILAADDGGSLWRSTDGGTAWTEETGAGSHYWFSVASSADGEKLVAVANYGSYIETSSDGGATWVTVTGAGSRNWRAVASSADGSTLIAIGDTYLYISTDGGVSWTQAVSAGSNNWRSVAVSSDGSKMVAAARFGDRIYSSDGGTTWIPTNSDVRDWIAVTMSADGNTIVAADSGAYLYRSTDNGSTWAPLPSAGQHNWVSLASSSDGSKLIAAETGGSLYISTDSGATWAEQTSAGTHAWQAVSMSSDGRRVIAADNTPGELALGTMPIVTQQSLSTVAPPADVPPPLAEGTLAATGACNDIQTSSTGLLSPSSAGVSPSNIKLLGGLSFALGCTASGGTARASLTLPSMTDPVANMRVYKSSGGTLTDITDQATITNDGEMHITYNLVDGGSLDEDGVVNGIIVDPVFIGIVQPATTSPEAPTPTLASTGSSVTQMITLGLSLLIAPVVGGGIWAARRHMTRRQLK